MEKAENSFASKVVQWSPWPPCVSHCVMSWTVCIGWTEVITGQNYYCGTNMRGRDATCKPGRGAFTTTAPELSSSLQFITSTTPELITPQLITTKTPELSSSQITSVYKFSNKNVLYIYSKDIKMFPTHFQSFPDMKASHTKYVKFPRCFFFP